MQNIIFTHFFKYSLLNALHKYLLIEKLKQIDINSDGFIDFNEFTRLANTLEAIGTHDRLL